MSPQSPTTTILLLSANPQGISPQRLDREKRDIEEGLKRSPHREFFRLETKSAVRTEDLRRALLELSPQIVHFSGQGTADAGLVFEDESGQPHLISAAALAELFELFANKLQCVILNACYSEVHAEAIAQHISYVVGMNGAISDQAAIDFAVGFYDALGAGRDFEFAYELGCSAAQVNGENGLSAVLKKKPSAESRSLTIAPLSLQPFSPAIYSASTWVERLEITAPLLQILQGGCRILALAGITGIGKTVLAERLISELQDEKQFCRLNLDEGRVGTKFSSSGAALLRSLGEEPTIVDQQDPQTLLQHLLHLLRSRPYRVQIDSMEKLLKEDDHHGWSEFCDSLWLELLQLLLAGDKCQSQLILTTQDLPGGLEAIGSRYPRLWHCQTVRGLSAAEQLDLFARWGLPVDKPDYLQRIGKLYEGHPLVLRVIAADLKENCGGDVIRYWKECRFNELEKNRPTQLSRRKLQLEVKQRVQQAIDRLPNVARQLLCRSAVYRRPVPESFWFVMLPDYTEAQRNTALNLLKSCALAEEDWGFGSWLGTDESLPLRQHSLIRSVAYHLLAADQSVWKTAERRAAQRWLKAYEPTSDIPNLEKVRGYLEAFDHYCNLEDWETATQILLKSQLRNLDNYCISSDDFTSLGWQLGNWGYYKQQIEAHSRLLRILDNKLGNAMKRHSFTRLECLNTIGTAYCVLGNYDEAIKYLNQAQDVVCRNKEEIGILLGNLGLAYSSIGKYHKAIELLQKALGIIRNTLDRKSEASIVGNLGRAYSFLGNYTKAIEYHEQQLAIATEIKDYKNEGYALEGLGIAYRFLDNLSKAEAYHQKQLAIAKKFGYRDLEGIALGSLGCVCYHLGNYPEAIKYHRQHLEIAQNSSIRQSEASALMRLGEAHIKLEQYLEAQKQLKTALEIAKELGNPSEQAESLRLLSILQEEQGNLESALELCHQALTITSELDTPILKACQRLKARLDQARSKK